LYLALDSTSLDSRAAALEIKIKSDEISDRLRAFSTALFLNRQAQEENTAKFFRNYVLTNKIEHDAQEIEKNIYSYKKYLLKIVPEDQTVLREFIDKSIQFGKTEFNNNPETIYNNVLRVCET
ncbi:MAG: hypothetical protein HC896_18350, partial [Bacteroidales bacterium]|nr:hypothetical protein [Bacteroidales bacterium]